MPLTTMTRETFPPTRQPSPYDRRNTLATAHLLHSRDGGLRRFAGEDARQAGACRGRGRRAIVLRRPQLRPQIRHLRDHDAPTTRCVTLLPTIALSALDAGPAQHIFASSRSLHQLGRTIWSIPHVSRGPLARSGQDFCDDLLPDIHARIARCTSSSMWSRMRRARCLLLPRY